MHEHIARAMYYFSVHLLYASIVGAAAWVLTTIRGASATTKYWIWVVTALNFIAPIGALIDKLWAPHLSWATPLGVIGGPIWDMTRRPDGSSGCRDMGRWCIGDAFATDFAYTQGAPRGEATVRPARNGPLLIS